MAKVTTNMEQQPTELPTHPNRDRYSSMFSEDNPDVNFEDKEARYGRMADEREQYRNLRSSGRQLSSALEGNRWLAAMFMDLKDNPEMNPLVWFANNGIDIKAALDDPNTMKQVDEKFKNWQAKQVAAEAAEKEQDNAIRQSLQELASVQQKYGLSDEQFDHIWEYFWGEVYQPAFGGTVTKDTWEAILHAMNYDNDMANAREEAAMQARNEKHANKVKNFDEQNVPPTFGQGTGGRVTPQRKNKRESLLDFVKRNT